MRQLRALLWKEWRQMRALALGLAIGSVVWVFATWGYVDFARDMGETIAAAVALFIGFAAIVIPASAIAGERASGALAFLLERPAGRGRVLAAKVIASLLLCSLLAALAIGIGLVCLWLAGVEARSLRDLLPWLWPRRGWRPWGVLLPPGLALGILFSSALLVSAGVSRPLLAVVLAVPVAALLSVVLVTYPYCLLAARGVPASVPGRVAFAVLRPALEAFVCLWPLGMAWLVFARVRDGSGGARRKAGAFARAFGLSALVFLGPHLVANGLLRAWYAILTPRDITLVSWPLCLSPDGQNLAFHSSVPALPFDSPRGRGCLVDVATGQARLATRARASMLADPAWSLDSRYLAYYTSPGWLSEAARDTCERLTWHTFWYGQYGQVVGFLDTATGTALELRSPASRDARLVGWLSGREAILLNWLGAHYERCDVTTGSIEPFVLPPLPEGAQGGSWWCRGCGRPLHATVTARGHEEYLALFDAASGHWTMHALGAYTTVVDVSPDARYVLLRIGDIEHEHLRTELLDLATGARTVLLVKADNDYPFEETQFSPGGTWLLVRTRDRTATARERVRLLRLRSGQWKDLPSLAAPAGSEPGAAASTPPSWATYRWKPRFSRDDSKIVWLCEDPAGRLEDRALPRYFVQDIATGRLRALPIPRGTAPPSGYPRTVTGADALFFTCGGAAVYRIRLDGTGLERIFPEKEPLTLEQFEAEAMHSR